MLSFGPTALSTEQNKNTRYFGYPLDKLTPIELRNRTMVHSVRQKRQFGALALTAARYIPSFLLNTIVPVFKTLLSGGKGHVAAK